MNVEFEVDTETWNTGGYDPDDEWSRDSTAGRVTNVSATETQEAAHTHGGGYGSYIKAFPYASPGDDLWVVVVDYESGDTFGRSGGFYQIVDAFGTPEEAEALLAAVNAYNGDGRGAIPKIESGLVHNDVRYYTGWVGYFESVNSVDIWVCSIKPRKGSPESRRYRYKRGR